MTYSPAVATGGGKIHIIREVAGQNSSNPDVYLSVKDSSVMLYLARAAFYPAFAFLPRPRLHVDTAGKPYVDVMQEFQVIVRHEIAHGQ